MLGLGPHSSSFFFSSLILSRRRLDVYRTSTQCGFSANLQCRFELCCTRLAEKYRTQKIAKNSPSAHHCTTLSGCIFANRQSEKKLVKEQYLLHMSPQYRELRPLTAEIRSLVWGNPANFNGFRVLASLLHRRRSTEVNQTLHNI